MYACVVDVSKAFDHVKHDKLFELDLEMKRNPSHCMKNYHGSVSLSD